MVELVSVTTADGVRLDGSLRRASGSAPRLGLDLIICHHGQGGSFYAPSMLAGMADGFVDGGCSVLRVNSRGHDLMFGGPNGRRLGASHEIIDECRHDWAAWLDFAEQAGFTRIGLWGHSLGAVKTIYYLAIQPDRRVRCAIASSPPRFNYEAYAAWPDGGSAFIADIARARSLVEADRGQELLLSTMPQRNWFSALSYVDKYGPDNRYDFFRHVPAVSVPLLLTVGGLEGGFNFQALASEGASLAASLPHVTFASIDGADHSYQSRIPEVWTLARDWLERAFSPTTA
jgi:pimeloyl-ACP methyl ester carboxylesterase